MNEYYIAYGKNGSDGRMAVYYCPFCGGSTPKSRAASLFAHATQQEERRITELFRGIRTVADVIARFGPPHEERENGLSIRRPSREGNPERGEVFRVLVYKNLSAVANIEFQVGDSDSARGSWAQKYIGDHAGNPSPEP